AAFALLVASGCGEQPGSPGNDTTAAPKDGGQSPVAAPYAAMGIIVGELTPESALVQVRLTDTERLVDGDVPGDEGVVEFTLRPEKADEAATATDKQSKPQLVEAKPERDFIARVHFSGLKPGTRYTCETRIGRDKDSLKAGPVATFQTLPGADQAVPVSFAVVTGMNYAKFHGDNRIDRQ